MLGLLDKECRTATASKGYNASAIMFGEAKEGAVEAHNFSSSASITTIHLKNMSNSRSVAMEKMLAKSVFSIATSKVTSEGSEEEMDKDNDSDSNAGSATKPGVTIEGMQMLTRCHKKLSGDSMQEDKASGDNDEKDAQERNHKEAVQVTNNMNAVTAKLQLSSLDKDQDKDNNKEFDNAINRENSINPYSEDVGDKDFLKEDLSNQQEDLTLGDELNTALEVSLGVFDATHSNTFKEPDNFKQFLWNVAGPSPGSMIILLDLLKDDLEADQAGLLADFDKIPLKLLKFMVLDAGEDREGQIKFIKQITEELEQIGQTDSHNKESSLEGGTDQPSEASKTQGTLPGAHKVSPTEEAAIEPAIMVERDKKGAQSLSMAPPG